MKIARASMMPTSHLCLWKHLYDKLQNEVVVAGSFAAAQMRYNKFGSTNSYNDIDCWYNEDHDNLLTMVDIEALVGEINCVVCLSRTAINSMFFLHLFLIIILFVCRFLQFYKS